MKRTGFTLIELLVVIAIIAILAAILFPVFAKAREKALANTCLSNTKQIVLSILMYCTDWDSHFPNNWESTGYGEAAAGRVGGVNWGWYDPLLPYVKNSALWICPDDQVLQADTPILPNKPSYVGSGNVWGNNGPATIGIAQNFVVNPACTILVGELDGANNNPRLMAGGDYRFSIVNKQAGMYDAIQRHNGGANWGLCDGHAKWYVWGNLYYEYNGAANGLGQPNDTGAGCAATAPQSCTSPTSFGAYQAWFDYFLP